MEVKVKTAFLRDAVSVVGTGISGDTTLGKKNHKAELYYTPLGLIVRHPGGESLIPSTNVRVAHLEVEQDERAKNVG